MDYKGSVLMEGLVHCDSKYDAVIRIWYKEGGVA